MSPQALSPTDTQKLDGLAAQVRIHLGRSFNDIIEAGKRLILAKEMLDHGRFIEWLNTEFGLSARSAQNFMSAARRFGGGNATVAHLPAGVLYELSAPSTSETVVERVISGEIPPRVDTIRAAKASAEPLSYPVRQPGELPDTGLIEGARNLLSPAEVRTKRRFASYLRRVTVAIGEQFRLKGWDSNKVVADACAEILGEEEAAELGQRIGPAAYNLLAVAQYLGYDPNAEE